jgi:hypothetical protein
MYVNVSFPLRFFSSQLKFLAKQCMLVNPAEEFSRGFINGKD